MGWEALIPLIGPILGGALGAVGSNQASNAAQAGTKEATQLQRDALNAALAMNEPARGLGYQAMGDLSSLYGYSQAPYTPLSQLMGGGVGSVGYGGPMQQELYSQEIRRMLAAGMTPEQIQAQGNLTSDLNGQRVRRLENAIKKKYVNKNDLATLAQQYGVTLTGKNKKDKKAVTAAIMNSFYTDAQAPVEGGAGGWVPGGGPIKPNQTAAGEYAYADGVVPTSGTNQPNSGTAGNFDRFFASPDYQFRQQEGVKALDRGAAARGGVLSGNRLRAGTELSSNLAAGEYGNYFNRLMAMVTGTQAATNNNSNAIMSSGGNLAQLAQDNGVARASGIMGMGNSVMNGINSGINAYYLNKYFGK